MTRSSVPSSYYHGASKPTAAAPPLNRWEGHGCKAFCHDLMNALTLPVDYGACDVLVTDLPWRTGFSKFNQRAGVEDARTYTGFMDRVSEIVESTSVPLYLVTGLHALPKLPKPDVVLPMRLNEDDAIAVSYRPGAEADRSYGVVPEFLHALAQRYNTVGDFCCGYGRSARFFLRSGKRAVVSDFNPRCIGYIAEHAPSWVGP